MVEPSIRLSADMFRASAIRVSCLLRGSRFPDSYWRIVISAMPHFAASIFWVRPAAFLYILIFSEILMRNSLLRDIARQMVIDI